jgi:DNA-binding HxlR family transcriptional regulator
MDQPLVEVSGKRKTGKRGPQAFEYNLTEFGKDVAALLQRLE